VVTPLMSGEAPQQGSINLQLPDAAPVVWTNIFTGDVFSQADGVLELKELWSRFPIALLKGRVD